MADESSLVGKYNPIHKRTPETGITHSYQGRRTQEEPYDLDQLEEKLANMRMQKSQLVRDHKFNQGFFKIEDEDFRGAERWLEGKIAKLKSDQKSENQLKKEWSMMARAMPLFVVQHEKAQREGKGGKFNPNNETTLSILRNRFFHHERDR